MWSWNRSLAALSPHQSAKLDEEAPHLEQLQAAILTTYLLMALDLAAIFASLKDSPNVNQGPALIGTIWTLLALSILVVCLRLYAKLKTARRIYVDDWLMVTALVRIILLRCDQVQ